MKFAFMYHPIQFYLITILTSLALVPVAAWFSYRDQAEKVLPLLLIDLAVPCVTAMAMIYLSGSREMVQDFWARLMLFKIQPSFLLFILFLMPCTILLATAISLLFGASTSQFSIAKELSVMKGWSVLGIFIPLLIAPFIEELGWRGYGVDSLRAYNNLFTTSVLFGVLWGLWHLPLFFVKGYYQNQLWDLGVIHVLNFFVSVFVIAFLMNWVYYHTGRSIPVIVLFHSMLNLSSILFRTEPITKCIATVLLIAVLMVIIVQDRAFFFDKGDSTIPFAAPENIQQFHHIPELNQRLQSELDQLRQEYGFPGATVSYVLPNGKMGSLATGFADVERGSPMPSHSRMLAASIGKTFVAATTLALAKEGYLNLDDRLSEWLGEHPWYSRLPNSETIILRHLLTHSSGLPDHVKTAGFAEMLTDRSLLFDKNKVPEILVGFILDQPPLFEAGEGWSYSDTGYILLGLVIEAASGNRYYDEVDRRFIKPLGLQRTSPSDRRDLPLLVAGYTSEDSFLPSPAKTVDEEGVLLWNPALEWAGGGLVSCSHDLALWAKSLYEGDAIPQDYLNDLLQSVPTEGPESKLFYGLGVAIEDRGSLGNRYGHGGVIPGYTSSMRYYPKYGVAIAFQINSDKGVSDHSTDLVTDMEQRLEGIVLNESSFTKMNVMRE